MLRRGARGADGIEGQGDKMGVGEFLSGKSVPAIPHEEDCNLRENDTFQLDVNVGGRGENYRLPSVKRCALHRSSTVGKHT